MVEMFTEHNNLDVFRNDYNETWNIDIFRN